MILTEARKLKKMLKVCFIAYITNRIHELFRNLLTYFGFKRMDNKKMIMAVSPKARSSDGEAEAFARLYLHVEKGPKMYTSHEVDCGIKILICGLKEDFSHVVGLPSVDQIWFNNGIVLEDDKTLMDYGIYTKDEGHNHIIIVK